MVNDLQISKDLISCVVCRVYRSTKVNYWSKIEFVSHFVNDFKFLVEISSDDNFRMMELPEYSMSYNEINYIYSFAMLFISWWADLN